MRRDSNEHWGKPIKVFESEADAEAEAVRLKLLSAKLSEKTETVEQSEYFTTTARYHRAGKHRK